MEKSAVDVTILRLGILRQFLKRKYKFERSFRKTFAVFLKTAKVGYSGNLKISEKKRGQLWNTDQQSNITPDVIEKTEKSDGDGGGK